MDAGSSLSFFTLCWSYLVFKLPFFKFHHFSSSCPNQTLDAGKYNRRGPSQAELHLGYSVGSRSHTLPGLTPCQPWHHSARTCRVDTSDLFLIKTAHYLPLCSRIWEFKDDSDPSLIKIWQNNRRKLTTNETICRDEEKEPTFCRSYARADLFLSSDSSSFSVKPEKCTTWCISISSHVQ